MEALKTVLEKSNQMESGLVYKDINNIPRCKVCGEPIGIAVKMSFGTNVYPRACRCRREAYERQQIVDMNKQKQIRLKQIISNSMMNKNFKECTLENWNHELGNENLYNIAKQYILKFPQMKIENKGMLIYGEPGNGKTYFSACIANALVQKLVPVICVGAIALTERIGKMGG
jgi:DNA replication protein DnaC